MPAPIDGDPRSPRDRSADWMLGRRTFWLLLGLCAFSFLVVLLGLRGDPEPFRVAVVEGPIIGVLVWLFTVALAAGFRWRARRQADAARRRTS